jgi:hypothetical protein
LGTRPWDDYLVNACGPLTVANRVGKPKDDPLGMVIFLRPLGRVERPKPNVSGAHVLAYGKKPGRGTKLRIML